MIMGAKGSAKASASELPLEQLLGEVRCALTLKLWMVSLATALTLPDICAALGSADGTTSKARYIEWFDRWVALKYSARFNGTECYSYRCRLLHQGISGATPSRTPKAGEASSRYERIIFVDPSSSSYHSISDRRALILDIPQFVGDIISSVESWRETVRGTQPFETTAQDLFRKHPQGIAPYIGGGAVYG
jgi:hypothetical protein